MLCIIIKIMGLIDITGMVFGKLTVIERSRIRIGNSCFKWVCKCECGKFKEILGSSLRGGITKSCGCMSGGYKIHDMAYSSEYQAYRNMKARCYQKTSKYFKYYGGRNITVCDKWLGKNGFIQFYKDMGNKPSENHSLDRKNPNLGYSKRNCRWATQFQQSINKRNTVWITYNKIKKTLVEWAIELGVHHNNIYAHRTRGKSFKWIYTHYKNKKCSIKQST